MPWWSKASYIRVPDFPSAADLWACGEATESANESDFGLVLLDEIAVAANAREWKENGRKELIDYFRQTRKHGFDKFFLSQGLSSIDSQIRNDLIKFEVVCRRSDSFRFPIIGGILQMIGFKAMLPNVHVASVKVGKDRGAMVVDRWYTRGKKWYRAYNTKQKYTPYNKVLKPKNQFRTGPTPAGNITVYADYDRHNQEVVGIYCVLSAWHLRGRYLSQVERHQGAIMKAIYAAMFIGFLAYIPHFYRAFDRHYLEPTRMAAAEKQKTKPLEDVSYTLKGVLNNGYFYVLTLSDGQTVLTRKTETRNGETFYRYNEKWMAIKDEKNTDKNTPSLPSLF